MYLLVDVGNSSIKWNTYDAQHRQLLLTPHSFLWRDGDLAAHLEEQWGGLNGIDSVLLANVAGQKVEQTLQQWLYARGWHGRVIHTRPLAFGIRNAYKIPGQLGVDRWLAVLAAAHLQPQRAVCVVSCGTAITVDTVKGGGDHLGGLIIPGIQMMKNALEQHTHGVKIGHDDAQVSPFSDSTGAAANNGVLLAAIGFVERAVGEIEAQLGSDLEKIITGGDARLIWENARYAFKHEPELVLKGLALYAHELT